MRWTTVCKQLLNELATEKKNTFWQQLHIQIQIQFQCVGFWNRMQEDEEIWKVNFVFETRQTNSPCSIEQPEGAEEIQQGQHKYVRREERAANQSRDGVSMETSASPQDKPLSAWGKVKRWGRVKYKINFLSLNKSHGVGSAIERMTIWWNHNGYSLCGTSEWLLSHKDEMYPPSRNYRLLKLMFKKKNIKAIDIFSSLVIEVKQVSFLPAGCRTLCTGCYMLCWEKIWIHSNILCSYKMAAK